MTPVVRRALVADAAALTTLEASAALHPWSLASVTETLRAPTTVAWLASIDDAPVGYLVTTELPDADLTQALGTCEILTIGVRPDARRRGIAASLLAEATRRWRIQRIGQVFLEVREDNAPARALYAALGFAETGLRQDYYAPGVHARCLTLELD